MIDRLLYALGDQAPHGPYFDIIPPSFLSPMRHVDQELRRTVCDWPAAVKTLLDLLEETKAPSDSPIQITQGSGTRPFDPVSASLLSKMSSDAKRSVAAQAEFALTTAAAGIRAMMCPPTGWNEKRIADRL